MNARQLPTNIFPAKVNEWEIILIADARPGKQKWAFVQLMTSNYYPNNMYILTLMIEGKFKSTTNKPIWWEIQFSMPLHVNKAGFFENIEYKMARAQEVHKVDHAKVMHVNDFAIISHLLIKVNLR